MKEDELEYECGCVERCIGEVYVIGGQCGGV